MGLCGFGLLCCRTGGELFEGLYQVRNLEGFVEVSSVVLGKGLGLEAYIAVAGDDKDGKVGVLIFDDLENLQSVNVGHEDVGYKVVVCDAFFAGLVEFVDCGNSVRAGNGAVAFLFEAKREISADFGFVIDYEYAAFHWKHPKIG